MPTHSAARVVARVVAARVRDGDASSRGSRAARMASTRDERDARATNATPTIRALDGRAFVHDAADVVELRERRRVIGAMVGALPGFRSQDVARGLPLELTAEETALCVERGWARLTEERDGDDAGTTGRERATEGDDATRDDALKRAKARAKAKRDGRGWGGGGAKRAKSAPATNVSGWEKVVAGESSFVSVPLTNDGDGEEEDARWSFPSTREERERYAVFKDLHDKSFYMTSGAKFGSDFLAYPGDPILFHAHYTVRIVSWDAVIHPLVIAATTRMSNAARKNFVVAAVRATDANGENFEVRYFTMEADVDLSSNRGY